MTRLEKFCDAAIDKLQEAIDVLRALKQQKTDAVRWLRNECEHRGELTFNTNAILNELEELEADEVFGHREPQEVA